MASITDDQRDLRSAQRDSKRFRDSNTKWSYGARPSVGCKIDWNTLEAVGGSESQRTKMRPRGKLSDESHHKKRDPNSIKGRPSWEGPQKRHQAAARARDEILDTGMSRSLLGLDAPVGQRKLSLSESFTYSFDRTESPGRPQSLAVYVRPATERDTERLVQREYEVLDTLGQPLRGKKAKMSLRKQDSTAETIYTTEDEGFELI